MFESLANVCFLDETRQGANGAVVQTPQRSNQGGRFPKLGCLKHPKTIGFPWFPHGKRTNMTILDDREVSWDLLGSLSLSLRDATLGAEEYEY